MICAKRKGGSGTIGRIQVGRNYLRDLNPPFKPCVTFPITRLTEKLSSMSFRHHKTGIRISNSANQRNNAQGTKPVIAILIQEVRTPALMPFGFKERQPQPEIALNLQELPMSIAPAEVVDPSA